MNLARLASIVAALEQQLAADDLEVAGRGQASQRQGLDAD